MLCEYKVLKSAFEAIENGKKSVELRIVNAKKTRQGDFVRFCEYQGNRSVFVVVDKVLYYENIDEAMQSIDKSLWGFEPESELEDILNQEFRRKSELPKIKAIYFHKPKISIVMPGYNSEKYLVDTLECIRKQKYRDFELVYLDDCSTDRTCDIIENYKNSFPVTCIRHDKHCGPAKLRNEGIKAAKGEYIIFLDSDDLFEANYFEQLINAMEYKKADVAIAEYDSFVSDEGYYDCIQPIVEDAFIDRGAEQIFCWNELPEYMIHLTNVPWNKMFRRKFLIENHVWFQNLPCSNDVYFSHYTMAIGKLIHVKDKDALIHYRIGRSNSISDKHDYFSELKAYEKLFEKFKGADSQTISKLYEDMLAGVFKYIRWGNGYLHKQFFDLIKKDILNNHVYFPEEFIQKKQPWVKEIFLKYEYDNPIYRVNYMVLKQAEDKTERIEQLFDELSKIGKIGAIKWSQELEYLTRHFEKKRICWILGMDCRIHKPRALICTNPLHWTELELFRRQNELDDVEIITIYDI